MFSKWDKIHSKPTISTIFFGLNLTSSHLPTFCVFALTKKLIFDQRHYWQDLSHLNCTTLKHLGPFNQWKQPFNRNGVLLDLPHPWWILPIQLYTIIGTNLKVGVFELFFIVKKRVSHLGVWLSTFIQAHLNFLQLSVKILFSWIIYFNFFYLFLNSLK